MKPNLQTVHSLLGQCLSNPSDQVRLTSQLAEMVRQLPPSQSAVISRPVFERCGDHVLACNFFNVQDEPTDFQTENVKVPWDCWVRSVHATAVVSTDPENIPELLWEASTERGALALYGTAFRGLFELNWTINGGSGFITNGRGEMLAPASLLTGDGEFPALLDWRLQRNDTIEVRVRSRIRAMFPTTCTAKILRTIPWIAVCFWAERIKSG